MELECGRISRYILPAVRACVAEKMSERYNYNQQEIAIRLGIAQVAVSKYLNGRYSRSVKVIKDHIERRGLENNVLRYMNGHDMRKANEAINDLCADIATKNW